MWSIWTISRAIRVASRAAIESDGVTLIFLSPDSPDFIPIEQGFPQAEGPLRVAAERTDHRLRNAIGYILDLCSPRECTKNFAPHRHDAD
jgi:transposase